MTKTNCISFLPFTIIIMKLERYKKKAQKQRQHKMTSSQVAKLSKEKNWTQFQILSTFHHNVMNVNGFFLNVGTIA